MTHERLRELYLLANSIGASLSLPYTGRLQIVPVLPVLWRPEEARCLTGHVTLWSQGVCDDAASLEDDPRFGLDSGDGDTLNEAEARAYQEQERIDNERDRTVGRPDGDAG